MEQKSVYFVFRVGMDAAGERAARIHTTTQESFQQFLQEKCEEAYQVLPPDESIFLIIEHSHPHLNMKKKCCINCKLNMTNL